MAQMSATEATRTRTTAAAENVDGGVSFTDLVARATATAVFEGYGCQQPSMTEAMAKRKVCMSIPLFCQVHNILY